MSMRSLSLPLSLLLRSSPTLSFLAKRFTQQVLFVPRALACCLPRSGRGVTGLNWRKECLAEDHNKGQGYSTFSCIQERKHCKSLAQKWQAVSRNVVLLPNNLYFKSMIERAPASTLPNRITIYQGTWYMNTSRGMQSNRLLLFDNNQQIHLIPAIFSTCKAENTSQDKAVIR